MPLTDREIYELLKKLTLEQKIGQLNMVGGSIYTEFKPEEQDELLKRGLIGSMMYANPKINNTLQKRHLNSHENAIPILFCADVIHGAKTNFPLPLAESCSWDLDLAKRSAEIMAQEASALGVRLTFAPMADLAYDARWGRNVEGAGEDPYLASLFTKARVEGFQGPNRENIDQFHVGATIKHFAGYSYVTAGKDYNYSSIDDRTLKTKVFRPYKAGVDAGAVSVMTAFNDIHGIPCVSNEYLLKDVLRKEWGFDGVIVSDYASIRQNITQHFDANEKEAALSSFKATNDIDMESRIYTEQLPLLIKKGLISEDELDEAIFRVLKLKSRLGLFDNPYVDEKREEKDFETEKALNIAYESAAKSLVLLKNSDELLPLSKNSKVALIGRFANERAVLNGSWTMGYNDHTPTICEVFSAKGHSFTYSKGYEKDKLLTTEVADAVAKSDVIVACLGHEASLSGEAASLSKIELPPMEQKLFDHLLTYKKPIVVLLLSARPLAIEKITEKADALIMGWALGTKAAEALVDTLYGKNNPSGKLTMTIPRNAGQCPITYNGYQECRPYNPIDYYTATYRDIKEGPLFPFGFGLSYNEYRYGKPSIINSNIKFGDVIEVTLPIENNGEYDGREIIQVYVSKQSSRPLRPRLELVSFEVVNLKPYEKQLITLNIPSVNLAYENEDPRGEYKLFIGPNSVDTKELTIKII